MMVKGARLLHTEEHVYGGGLKGAHSLSLRNCLSAHHQSPITEAEGEGGAHALRHDDLKVATLHTAW